MRSNARSRNGSNGRLASGTGFEQISCDVRRKARNKGHPMTRKKSPAFVILVVLTGVASTAHAAPAEAKPDAAAAAKGKIIYQRYCGSCHGAEARGNGPLAPDLRLPPADLTRLAEKNGGQFPFAAVAQAVDGRKTTRGHGAPDMPVWGEVFPKTAGTDSPSVESAVGRLTHYIWSIQKTAK
jgi:mono/diheme cytochrome c family protein